MHIPLITSQAPLSSPVLSSPAAVVPTSTMVANVCGLLVQLPEKRTGPAMDAQDQVGARHGCGLGRSG
jgi:hypothetical protein